MARTPEQIKEYRRQHYLKNKDKYKERARKWKAANPEKVSESGRRRYAKKKDHILAVSKAYYHSLPKEITRERGRAWRQRNSGRCASYCANRRSRISKQRLSGIDDRELSAFYEMAARVSSCTGIPHEVDHYYPLKGDTSCGLHVPWNLRVIPASINRSKNNKLPEEYHGLQ